MNTYDQITALLKAKQAEQLLLEGLTTDGLPTQQEAIELLADAIALRGGVNANIAGRGGEGDREHDTWLGVGASHVHAKLRPARCS